VAAEQDGGQLGGRGLETRQFFRIEKMMKICTIAEDGDEK
jgi:hypothetical protein